MIVAAACLASASQDGAILRRELKEGARDVYKVESKADQTIQLSQLGRDDQQVLVTSGMKLALTTGKVDAEKKSAELEMVSTDFTFNAEGLAGMAPMPQMPEKITVLGKIDNQNRVTGMKTVGAGARMMAASLNASTGMLFISFSEQPVRVGDTWEVLVPKNPAMGNADTILKATLTGEEMDGEVPVWIVTMKGPLVLNVDLSEVMKDDPQAGAMAGMGSMKMSGTIDLLSEARVEKGTGRTRKMVVKMKGKQTMEMVDFGMTIEMLTSGVTTMSLLDEK